MFNRVVDVSTYIEKKIDAIVECRSQGGGSSGSRLRARLSKQGKRLPLLGNDDRTADREYVHKFLLDEDREAGGEHKLAFTERFYYIDERRPEDSRADRCVRENSVPL